MLITLAVVFQLFLEKNRKAVTSAIEVLTNNTFIFFLKPGWVLAKNCNCTGSNEQKTSVQILKILVLGEELDSHDLHLYAVKNQRS